MKSPWGDQVVVGRYGGHDGLVYRDRPRTFAELFAGVDRWEQRTFLVQGERRITFGAFFAAVRGARDRLEAIGIQPRDRVLLLGYNSPDWVLTLLALWSLSAVPVLGNRWWSAGEAAHSIELVGARAVVTDAPELVPFGGTVLPLTALRGCFGDAGTSHLDIPGPAGEENPAVILFTSGSIGMPKAVALPFRSVVANQQNVLARSSQLPHTIPAGPQSPERQPVNVISTPLFHIGAFSTLITQLITGARIVFTVGRFDPAHALALIETERVERWGAVPTMAIRLLEHPDFDSHDLSSLRSFPLGGAPVPPALLERLASRLPQLRTRGVANTWGMTEGGGFFTMASNADLHRFPRTAGRALPTVGFLFIDGRSKDMVIRGGENIACPHVEGALLRHPDVVEAAAIGLPHPELGEELAAVIVHRPGGRAPTEAELSEHLAGVLAYFEIPSRWIIREQPLPTVGTEKVDKKNLRLEFD